MELFFSWQNKMLQMPVTWCNRLHGSDIGTHKYTIKEVVPADQANIQYDGVKWDVTVTVTNDEASNAIQVVASYGEKNLYQQGYPTNSE